VDHAGARALLADGAWEGATGLTWTLLKGDFLQRMDEAPLPDVIFYDPFSYKTEDAGLWSAEAFAQLARRLERAPKPVCIYTYTRATRVRAQLLAAGFHVGHGVGTGAKSETTVAVAFGRKGGQWTAAEKRAFCAGRGIELLGEKWLGRWGRSQLKDPALDGIVRSAAQFF
jgi:queuine tRNA-ribosyltransferase